MPSFPVEKDIIRSLSEDLLNLDAARAKTMCRHIDRPSITKRVLFQFFFGASPCCGPSVHKDNAHIVSVDHEIVWGVQYTRSINGCLQTAGGLGVLDTLLRLKCIKKTRRYHYKSGVDNHHFTELRSRGSELLVI